MHSTTNPQYKKLVYTLLAVCFLVVWFARVRYAGADSMGSLMVADALITRGTIKLDRYGKEALEEYSYRIQNKNGHYYYYFPIGTPILSLPFVIMAKAIGIDPKTTDYALQVVVASFLSVATLYFLIQLAQFFLSLNQSLVIASVFWFGSSWASTSGAALWSHNWASLCALIAIYLTVRSIHLKNFASWPIISLCLFLAYFCRPTLSLLSPLLLLFLFSYNRKAAFYTALLLGLLLLAFVGFSFKEFQQILPDYYLPKRLAGGSFLQALLGNLFSPARGLFIYSPFILTAWFCFSWGNRKQKLKSTWLLIGVAWPLLHLISISQFPHWWGGFCYGPRLMMDVLPGLYLLTLHAWPSHFDFSFSKVSKVILSLSIVFSVFVNTWQGLFNPNTGRWNWQPNVDQRPELIFDWKYPQFLAGKNMLERRLREYAPQPPSEGTH